VVDFLAVPMVVYPASPLFSTDSPPTACRVEWDTVSPSIDIPAPLTDTHGHINGMMTSTEQLQQSVSTVLREVLVVICNLYNILTTYYNPFQFT
jgi:hypothetical protein